MSSKSFILLVDGPDLNWGPTDYDSAGLGFLIGEFDVPASTSNAGIGSPQFGSANAAALDHVVIVAAIHVI
jgi:hypothetical protein